MVFKENYVSILSLKFGPSHNSLTKQETPLCITELKEMLFKREKIFPTSSVFSICICIVWICLNIPVSVCFIYLNIVQENHEN